MNYNPAIHHRRSIRLKGYDYSRAGLYFITICVHDRVRLFGKIENAKMKLNDAGITINKWWQKIPEKYPDIELDNYQIMPNHFHAIIINKGIPIVRADISVRADPSVCPINGDLNLPESILGDHNLPESIQGDLNLPESILGDHNLPESIQGDLNLPEPILGDHNLPEPILGDHNLPEPILGGHNLGEHILGGHNLGEHILGDHNLGEHILGNHNLGEHILGNHNLGEHILGDHNLGEPILGGHNLPISTRGEHMGSPLSRIVQWFKTMTTNEYIRGVKNLGWIRFNGKLWQRNYWEHIIRNEQSYQRISEYIKNNPAKWNDDKFHN